MDNFCQKCQPGYIPQNGSGICLMECPQNCASCSMPNYCTACVNTTANLVLSNGICAVCPLSDPDFVNCAACNVDNKCSACKGIQYIISPKTYTCIQCADPNCVSCDNSTANCNQCVNSQYVVNGTKCVSSCSLPNCQTIDNKCKNCIICNTNYTNFNGVCYNCTNVNQCLICNGNNTCATCVTGYSALPNGTCISCSNLLCSACSS